MPSDVLSHQYHTLNKISWQWGLELFQRRRLVKWNIIFNCIVCSSDWTAEKNKPIKSHCHLNATTNYLLKLM